MTIEERVIEILRRHGFTHRGNDWNTYVSAKRLCLMEIDPVGSEYDAVIGAVVRYLNV